MAQLLVSQLDEAVKEALRRRARRHGRSKEEEARLILAQALASERDSILGTGCARRGHSLCFQPMPQAGASSQAADGCVDPGADPPAGHACGAAGPPVDLRDTRIAGIALAHQPQLATRNSRHLSGTTIILINPFTPMS